MTDHPISVQLQYVRTASVICELEGNEELHSRLATHVDKKKAAGQKMGVLDLRLVTAPRDDLLNAVGFMRQHGYRGPAADLWNDIYRATTGTA